MSSRVTPIDRPITIELDGRSVTVQEGEPLAVGLLAAGEVLLSRSSKYHRPRGAYCLSGGCAQCLVRVDGVPNVAACKTPARAGMRVERQNGFPAVDLDLFAATDLVFRSWFNHHEFLTGLPMGDTVLLQVAKHLAGLGVLPDRAPEPPAPAVREAVNVAIVGGGPAGLACARALHAHGVDFTLFEADEVVGGRLLTGPEADLPAPWQPPAERLRTGAAVVGLFADEGPLFLTVVQAGRLHLVSPRATVLAHGGQPGLPTFGNNDLPGIHAARAVGRMLRRHGVLPGRRVAVVGDPVEAGALATRLSGVGAEPVAIGAEPVEAHGATRVDALTVRQGGREFRVDCDAVAVCGPLTPAFELARAAGARVSWDAAQRLFTVECDPDGHTAHGDVYIAGELRGAMDVATAAAQGQAAAEALAAKLGGRP